MSAIEYRHFENFLCMYPRGAYSLKDIEEGMTEVERIENETGSPVDHFINLTGITSADLEADEMMMHSF